MSTLVGLFCTKLTLTITVSKYTTTISQNEPGSNGNEEGDSRLPRAPEIEPHHQMEFSAILMTNVFYSIAENVIKAL